MQLLTCSVQLGASHTSLVAWPALQVRGLIQRFLSHCGLELDPDAVELHLDRYLLPPMSSLGAVIARWHRPVVANDVICLKALVPRHVVAKPRVKLDARGPPIHTVRQVIGRAVAAMAMQPGPARWHSIASAAVDISLLPYTFTNWTDAWDYNLMKVAVSLFRALLPEKPAAASSVLQACSDLLDLPSAFAPRGHMYQGLCALQLHISLLQAANDLRATGLITGQQSSAVITPPFPAAAASTTEAEASCSSCSAGSSREGRGATGSEKGSKSSAGNGTGPAAYSGGTNSISSGSRTRLARQREVASAVLKQLLTKVAARAGLVLEQLSYYGSELSAILDEYRPPKPGQLGGSCASSGGNSNSSTISIKDGGVEGDPGAAGTLGSLPRAAQTYATRDLRLQVAEALEPYAAMQLLEAFGRMAMATYPTAVPTPLFPPSTLPSGWDCHRSLFHTILELGAQAGIPMGPEGRTDRNSHDGEQQGLRTITGLAGAASSGPVLELPLVASMLDVLLQLHVQAHAQCPSGGSKGVASRADGDDSDDGSSDAGHSCCPRTPALCQLPPCLDWLQDVTSVLEAACDVYALVGGLQETEGEVEAELQPGPAASASIAASVANAAAGGGDFPAEAVMTAAAIPTTAAAVLPIGSIVPATISVAVGATAATAAMSPVQSTRLDGDSVGGGATTAREDRITAPDKPIAMESSLSEALGNVIAAGAATSSSPGPSAPGTPLQPSNGSSGGCDVGCSSSDKEPSSLDRGNDNLAGTGARSCLMFLQPGETIPSDPHTIPKAAVPTGAATTLAEEDDDDNQDEKEIVAATAAVVAPCTPLQASTVSATQQLPAGVPANAAAGSALKLGAAVAAPGPAPVAAVGAPSTAAGPITFALPSARLMIVDALHRAFQCPCLVEQLLASGPRAGELCERAVWRHPRLAGCAPAAAYYKQALDNLLKPLSYVYDEDDYDAPVVYVDRSDMLGTSFVSLMDVEDFLDHEGICVKFEDEDAYGDGVLREWLTEIAASVFDPNAGLFRLCEGDGRALHLSPAGSQQDDQLELLRFAGRILGLAMRARVPLGLHLSTALFKLLQHPGWAGRARLGMADLAQLEPRLAATCSHIAAANDVEALGLTFVASCGHLGLAHEVPLLPGGAGEDVYVTAANRRDYLDRLVRFYCTWGCSSRHGRLLMDAGRAIRSEGGVGDSGDWDECELDAVAALAQGLAEALFRIPDSDEDDRVELLGARLRSISTAAFNSRLGGEVGGIDVESWRNHTSAPAFKSDRERAVLKAFWDVVSELSAEEQRRLLQFWTGISHLPAGGFKHLSQQLQLVPARPEDDCFGAGAGGAAALTYDEVPDVDLNLGAWRLRPTGSSGGGGGDDLHGSRGGLGESHDPTAAVAEAPDSPRARMASVSATSGSDSGSHAGTSAGLEAGVAHDMSSISSGGTGVGDSGSSSGSGGNGSSASSGSVDTEGEDSGGAGGRGGHGGSDGGGEGGGVSSVEVALGADRPRAAGGRGVGSEHGAGAAAGPLLLAAHTCFFQLRLPLLQDKAAMREAVAESLANLGAFWNE